MGIISKIVSKGILGILVISSFPAYLGNFIATKAGERRLKREMKRHLSSSSACNCENVAKKTPSSSKNL